VCELSADGLVLTVRGRGEGSPLGAVEAERIGEAG
jgi:hypothetical protein